MTHQGNVHGDEFHPLLMTRLYANWGMFAPNPPNTSGWFVTVATQKNGKEVDVWNDGPVSFDMPNVPSATYKRQRWRKFGDNILSSNHAPIRGYFLRWLCREWNDSHSDAELIDKITLYHMAQTANWPSKGYGPLAKNELARETCPPPPEEVPKETVTPQQQKPKPLSRPQTLGNTSGATHNNPARSTAARGPLPQRPRTTTGATKHHTLERPPGQPRGMPGAPRATGAVRATTGTSRTTSGSPTR
jgi:hypothetical protein